MSGKIADQTYYLDGEGNVTTEHPGSGTVLINKGQEVPQGMADKYGIGKVAQEEKAAEPVSNKAKKPAENKGAK